MYIYIYIYFTDEIYTLGGFGINKYFRDEIYPLGGFEMYILVMIVYTFFHRNFNVFYTFLVLMKLVVYVYCINTSKFFLELFTKINKKRGKKKH